MCLLLMLNFECITFSSTDHPEDDLVKIMEETELKAKFPKIILNKNIILKMELVTSVSHVFTSLLSSSVFLVTTKSSATTTKIEEKTN